MNTNYRDDLKSFYLIMVLILYHFIQSFTGIKSLNHKIGDFPMTDKLTN